MSSTPHTDVCIIDDNESDRRLFARILEDAGFSVSLAEDFQAGLHAINTLHPKVGCVDFKLPGGNGLKLCRWARRDPANDGIYFILVSAHGTDELRGSAIERGVDDYLDKPVDHRNLVSRVSVGIRLHNMQQKLRKAAITDGLTGLYNHDYLNHVIESEMARSRRFGHPLALIMLDIDNFKGINDTFGHLAGNAVLVETSKLLRECVREIDTVGRFGGEEFLVVLPQASSRDAAGVAERMRSAMETSLVVPSLRGHAVTASFGVVDSDDSRVNSSSQLMDLTDRALYQAKRRGRNRVILATEVDERDNGSPSLQIEDVESLRRRVAALSLQAKDVYVQSVASLVQALDERDPYTARHARNVSFYAERLAMAMGCSRALVKSVRNAALLHDVGKVAVPDSVLLKTASLTPDEHALMSEVPLISTRIVDHLRILESEIQIIRHQREHFDGSGHPEGLKGTRIPIGARILLVADAFDAMTTNRVYRQRSSVEAVLGELVALAGKQFDPKIVAALQNLLEKEGDVWQTRIEETVQDLRNVTL